LLYNEQKGNKLDIIWKGPYEIKEINHPNVTIQELEKRKHITVHKNRIKQYFLLQMENNMGTADNIVHAIK
jgi:hypothetical protein